MKITINDLVRSLLEVSNAFQTRGEHEKAFAVGLAASLMDLSKNEKEIVICGIKQLQIPYSDQLARTPDGNVTIIYR